MKTKPFRRFFYYRLFNICIQESSRELEAELEAQIKQAEHQVRELRSTNHRLLIEHNSLKVITSQHIA